MKQSITKFVYQLKDGTFYKRHTIGSWEARSNGVRRKDITTKYVAVAQHYDHPMKGAPYSERFMNDGKWVKVKIITTYEILEG